MANLKEIRTRIASVASTRQITSAMKMVAAAKLKKAQDTVVNFRPYAHKMRTIMENAVSSAGQDYESMYTAVRDCRQALIVVITSNRGLCGAFNSNVIKETLQLAENKYNELPQNKIRYMAIGKKGYDILRKRMIPLDEYNTEIIEHLTYESAAEIAKSFMDAFISGRYDRIDIVYNEFINAASQKVVVKQFLPLLPEEQYPVDKGKKPKNKKEHIDYLLEPSGEHVFRKLISLNLRLLLYEALLNSVASEFGARMTSMHQATDNATTLIQELTLQYNKARQAAITNEIVEIVGGAEALKG